MQATTSSKALLFFSSSTYSYLYRDGSVILSFSAGSGQLHYSLRDATPLEYPTTLIPQKWAKQRGQR